MQACAHIYVEVDLGKGLPEDIKVKVDEWSHIQQLDYEQIPFKCKVCHEYGNFANHCTKLSNVDNNSQEEQWEVVKKKKSTPGLKLPNETGPSSHPPPSSHNPSNLTSSPPPSSPPLPQSSGMSKSLPYPPSSNPFHVLSLPEDDPIPFNLPESSSSPHSLTIPPPPPLYQIPSLLELLAATPRTKDPL